MCTPHHCIFIFKSASNTSSGVLTFSSSLLGYMHCSCRDWRWPTVNPDLNNEPGSAGAWPLDYRQEFIIFYYSTHTFASGSDILYNFPNSDVDHIRTVSGFGIELQSCLYQLDKSIRGISKQEVGKNTD